MVIERLLLSHMHRVTEPGRNQETQQRQANAESAQPCLRWQRFFCVAVHCRPAPRLRLRTRNHAIHANCTTQRNDRSHDARRKKLK